MKKQRVLIVGFGFMGEMHAQALGGIAQAEIVGIVDTFADAARAKAARLNLAVPVFSDLPAALKGIECDIINVCLPTDEHAAASIIALQAGKHVFCEKPVALSLADAENMRAAHMVSGKFFQVGHCIRFWPEYQAFEEFMKAGTAGRLLSLTMQRRAGRPAYSIGDWLNDEKRSMGAAVDLHIHDTDYVLHLLGKPDSVVSRGTRDQTGWSHIFTRYVFPDVVVEAEGGWDYPANWGFQMAFQAVFERAAIEYDSAAKSTLRVTLAGQAPAPLAFKAAGNQAAATVGNLSSLGGYANELCYFVDCVSQGRAPAIATLDQAIASLEVVLSELQSAGIGKPVSLK
ncbi:MAG: Gfo/Idh/MocA family oxidoreductase [Lacunisphaera sp.]|nr:Gfo/Idh/MocA family oxidoreductase [Lacunisphaera sp.]